MPVSTDALDEDVKELKAELRAMREEMLAGSKELREEMLAGFKGMREEMLAGFKEMRAGFERVNDKIDAVSAKANDKIDTGLAKVNTDIKMVELAQMEAKVSLAFAKKVGTLCLTAFLTVGLGAIVTFAYWGGTLGEQVKNLSEQVRNSSEQIKYLTDRVEGKPVSAPVPKP